jgi:hypothetical protein
MTVQDLVARFPEIPNDLRDEPILATFAETFTTLLGAARNPSNCAAQHDAGNHYYLKLIGPMAIYGYGLATRESVLSEIQELLDRHRANPDQFARSLLPEDTADHEVPGPGCS